MNAWLYLAIHDIACIAGIVVLVISDVPWYWPAVLVVALLFTTIKRQITPNK
uniref:Uncharacterized protein n=1 Tax=viral metagenome TaxID=1070528 RepID=A0A6M3ILG0_9ZZZZ